jgi:hypothetical protein
LIFHIRQSLSQSIYENVIFLRNPLVLIKPTIIPTIIQICQLSVPEYANLSDHEAKTSQQRRNNVDKFLSFLDEEMKEH